MPLKHSASDDARSANIAQLVKDGYPQKQAVAIAHSIQRKAKGETDDAPTESIFSKGQLAEMKLALGPARRQLAEADDEPDWARLKGDSDKLARELHAFQQAIGTKSKKDAVLAIANMLAHMSYLTNDLDLDAASHDVSSASSEAGRALRAMHTKGEAVRRLAKAAIVETSSQVGSIASARWVASAKPAALAKNLVWALEKLHARIDDPSEVAYHLDMVMAAAQKLGLSGQPWDALYSAGDDLIRAYHTMQAVDKKVAPHVPAAIAAAKKVQGQTK